MTLPRNLSDPHEVGSHPGHAYQPGMRFHKNYESDGQDRKLSVIPGGISWDSDREVHVRNCFAMLENEFSKLNPVPPWGSLGILHTEVTQDHAELESAYVQATEYLERHLRNTALKYRKRGRPH